MRVGVPASYSRVVLVVFLLLVVLVGRRTERDEPFERLVVHVGCGIELDRIPEASRGRIATPKRRERVTAIDEPHRKSRIELYGAIAIGEGRFVIAAQVMRVASIRVRVRV